MFERKLKVALIKKVATLKRASFFSMHFQTTQSSSLKQKYIDQEIKEAEEFSVPKQKKKKIGNLILLLFNFVVIAGIFIYYGFTNKMVSIDELISLDIKWVFLGLAVATFVLLNVIEGFRYFQLIRRSTKKNRFFLGLKTHMLGRYYDNITPLSAGGQPFQIFYLNKRGIKGDKATSIPLVEHMFTSIAFIIISLVVLIANIFYPITRNALIIVIACFGLIGNSLVMGTILVLSVSKRVGPAVIIKILKLLNKLHIIKNYKATFFKVSRFVKSYQKSMKSFAKSPFTVIFQILSAVCVYSLIYLMVYFIYYAFLPVGASAVVSYLEIFSCLIFCELCTSIMPLPGGSGLAEISFNTLFSRWFAAGVFTWALLIWKILTYFAYIAVGGTLIFSSYIKTLFKRKQIINNDKKSHPK